MDKIRKFWQLKWYEKLAGTITATILMLGLFAHVTGFLADFIDVFSPKETLPTTPFPTATITFTQPPATPAIQVDNQLNVEGSTIGSVTQIGNVGELQIAPTVTPKRSFQTSLSIPSALVPIVEYFQLVEGTTWTYEWISGQETDEGTIIRERRGSYTETIIQGLIVAKDGSFGIAKVKVDGLKPLDTCYYQSSTEKKDFWDISDDQSSSEPIYYWYVFDSSHLYEVCTYEDVVALTSAMKESDDNQTQGSSMKEWAEFLLAKFPLDVGDLWPMYSGVVEPRDDNFYYWSVDGEIDQTKLLGDDCMSPIIVPSLYGADQKDTMKTGPSCHVVILRTNPDVSVHIFCPGRGIVEKYYKHNGTLFDFCARLSDMDTSPK